MRAHFLQPLVGFVAKNGVVDIGALYRSPFTGSPPGGGLEGPSPEVMSIQHILEHVRVTAVPTDSQVG